MDCKAAKKTFVLLNEDALSSSEKTQVQAHIKECGACATLYTLLSQAFGIITEEKSNSPNVYLASKTIARARERYGFFSGKTMPTSTTVLRPALVYAVVLFTGLLLGFLIGGWFQPDSATTDTQNELAGEIFNTEDTDLLTIK